MSGQKDWKSMKMGVNWIENKEKMDRKQGENLYKIIKIC